MCSRPWKPDRVFSLKTGFGSNMTSMPSEIVATVVTMRATKHDRHKQPSDKQGDSEIPTGQDISHFIAYSEHNALMQPRRRLGKRPARHQTDGWLWLRKAFPDTSQCAMTQEPLAHYQQKRHRIDNVTERPREKSFGGNLDGAISILVRRGRLVRPAE